MADDSKLSKLADELDDSEDEITAEHYFRVEKGGTLIVDQTGKHKALGPDEPTPTDPQRQAATARLVNLVPMGHGAISY